MLQIPPALRTQFLAALRHHAVPSNEHAPFLKWLLYYLDFCRKHQIASAQPENLPRFLAKLHEKKQSIAQQQQAERAISLYYSMVQHGHAIIPRPSPGASVELRPQPPALANQPPLPQSVAVESTDVV